MKKRYKNAFRNKVLERIQSLSNKAILWEDLYDLGSARQISRALNDFVSDGTLIRIGQGIYAKAERSKYIDEPVIKEGFQTVCLDVLKRLGIRWELSQFVKDYNEGKSQQVPMRFEVRLKSRFRRTISYGNRKFQFEGNINAR